MRPKMHDHMRPRQIGKPRDNTARREIQNFLLAIGSYPERATREPSLTFRKHLRSFFGRPLSKTSSRR